MYKNLLLSAILCMLFFSSCKKEDNTEAWVSAAQDYGVAAAYIQEIFKIVDEATKNNSAVYKLASLDCAVITLEEDTSGAFPKTLIIDYGLVNCIGEDGRRRRGVVKVIYNERYSQPGTIVNILFENFFINNYKVAANNLTLTNSGNLIITQHHLNFPQLRFINPAGQSIDLNGSQTFKLITGDATQGIFDDIFAISGSFTGKDRIGNSFTATITEPLTLHYDCRSITAGLLNISLPDIDGVFNYGDGTCDDKAIITIDGRPFFINLE